MLLKLKNVRQAMKSLLTALKEGIDDIEKH